jgi:hypothetical protein
MAEIQGSFQMKFKCGYIAKHSRRFTVDIPQELSVVDGVIDEQELKAALKEVLAEHKEFNCLEYPTELWVWSGPKELFLTCVIFQYNGKGNPGRFFFESRGTVPVTETKAPKTDGSAYDLYRAEFESRASS